MNNYIERKLLEKNKYEEYGEYYPILKEQYKLFDLIVDSSKKESNKILLLGDAGCGKSTELEVTAKKLAENRNMDFIPVPPIKLDTYTPDEDIETYLVTKLGQGAEQILKSKQSNLIFFIDEYDQVIEKRRSTRRLFNFIDKFSESKFIISCRTNFYAKQFPAFTELILLPLEKKDIENYSQVKVGDNCQEFLSQLNRNKFNDFAKNPFFLNHFINIFNKDMNLPNTRSELFDRIINISIENDIEKYDVLRGYAKENIFKLLSRMALIMEANLRNFIKISDFERIINENGESNDLINLSLLKQTTFKNENVIQFQHNNFQEYLAANVLNKNSINIIKKFILIGEKYPFLESINKLINYLFYPIILVIKLFKPIVKIIDKVSGRDIASIEWPIDIINIQSKKINPSWVNTIAFLCQIRTGKDLIKYIKKRYPEIVLRFEIEIEDENLRNEFFKTVFNKYTVKNKIWFNRSDIDTDVLANFAKTKEAYDYLLKYARSNEYFMYKHNAIELLGRMKSYAKQDDQLKDMLIEYAKNDEEKSSVRDICLDSLLRLGFTDAETIEQLKELKNASDNSVVSGLYYLIAKSEALDSYLSILLEGIPRSRPSLSSDEMYHTSLGFSISSGIENIKSISGIKQLIGYFVENPRDLTEFHIKDSLDIIVDNIIEAYISEESIYEDMVTLLKKIDKDYIEDPIPNICNFFHKTDNTAKLFKEIYENEGIESNYGILTSIADIKCIDIIIDDYTKNILKEDHVWIFLNHLMRRNKNKYIHYEEYVVEKTGHFQREIKDYTQEREKEQKRKTEIIFNKNELIKEIEIIFGKLNKNTIVYDDVISLDDKDDETINRFVLNKMKAILYRDKLKQWSLTDLIEKIDSWNYSEFIAGHIRAMLKEEVEPKLTDDQIGIVKYFCLERLVNINYKQAFKSDGKNHESHPIAEWLWFFLRKYGFNYPENVLLDMLSYDWIEDGDFVGIEYLENKLSQENMKQQIIRNLHKGIDIGQVLCNHILYCRKHGLIETKNILFDIVRSSNYENKVKNLAIDTLGTFPETCSILEDLLDFSIQEPIISEKLDLFTKIAEILLVKKSSKYCERVLIKNLKLKKPEEKLLAIESAKILIEKNQNIKAIKYYIREFKDSILHERASFFDPLEEIKSNKAISPLLNLLKSAYVYNVEDNGHLNSKIIDVMKNIARNDHYKEVIKALKEFVGKYCKKYEVINFLNITIEEIEKESLINKSKKEKSLDEIIKEVDQIVS